MVRLITTYYKEKNQERKQEYLTCIKKNIECQYIDEYIILNEKGDVSTLSSNKIKIINIHKKPTYQDFFTVVNQATNDSDYNIIANTDIFFDLTLKKIEKVNLKNQCFALTRHNILPSGKYVFHKKTTSQDAWLFQGKINGIFGNFEIGLPRCDARIAYEISKAGYNISNPSLDIKIYHLHLSEVRSYTKKINTQRVPPPYKFVHMKSIDSNIRSIYLKINDLPRYYRFLKNTTLFIKYFDEIFSKLRSIFRKS